MLGWHLDTGLGGPLSGLPQKMRTEDQGHMTATPTCVCKCQAPAICLRPHIIYRNCVIICGVVAWSPVAHTPARLPPKVGYKLELSRAHAPHTLSICRILYRDRPVMLTISTSPVVGRVDRRGYDG